MIVRWDKRIDAMDTSKGVSNTMIREAMLGEIKELRKAVATLTERHQAFDARLKAQYAAGQASVMKDVKAAQAALEKARKQFKVRLAARTETARGRAVYWRRVAYAVQRELDLTKKGLNR